MDTALLPLIPAHRTMFSSELILSCEEKPVNPAGFPGIRMDRNEMAE